MADPERKETKEEDEEEEDGRRTYLELHRKKNEPIETPNKFLRLSRSLKHSLAKELTGVTWQLGIVILVFIEVLINLLLMLIQFGVIHEGANRMSYHLLHFAGLVILSVFVLEVFLKLYALGCEYFLEEKMEIFDAFVVITAFIVEIVLSVLHHLRPGWKGLGFVIVLRLWRIFRVIINITSVKKEFYELIEDCEDAAKDDVELIREEEKGLEQKQPLQEKGNKDP